MSCTEFSRFWVSAPARQRRLGSVLFAACALLSLTACRSPGGGHASVIISGQSLDNIRATATAVFNSAGYSLATSTPDEMTFQKLGSLGDGILYGGWEAKGVMSRVRVRFAPYADKDYQLVATAYTVRDAGDSVFEEENRKLVLSRGSYQKLLDEIKKRVEQGPPAAPAPKP